MDLFFSKKVRFSKKLKIYFEKRSFKKAYQYIMDFVYQAILLDLLGFGFRLLPPGWWVDMGTKLAGGNFEMARVDGL